MNKWNSKYLQALKKQGTIAGYKAPDRKKAYSEGKEVKIPGEKPKGLIWLEWNLKIWCQERNLTLKREYEFSEDRAFRSDFAIMEHRILCEYEGGIFMAKGGHNSASGIQRDIEKYALAEKLGWRVVRIHSLNYTTILKTLNEIIK